MSGRNRRKSWFGNHGGKDVWRYWMWHVLSSNTVGALINYMCMGSKVEGRALE